MAYQEEKIEYPEAEIKLPEQDEEMEVEESEFEKAVKILLGVEEEEAAVPSKLMTRTLKATAPTVSPLIQKAQEFRQYMLRFMEEANNET